MRTKRPEHAERMLDAAARLFGGQHFHEVRMEDVATEAGVGKGTIYRYFEDKDELYLSLLKRAGRQLAARIDQRVEAANAPIDQLVGMVSAVLEFFEEQPHVFELIQQADFLKGRATPWKQTRNRAIRLVKAIFAEAKRRGDFTIGDPATATLLLLGGMRATALYGPKASAPGVARRLVRMVLFGAASRAPAPSAGR